MTKVSLKYALLNIFKTKSWHSRIPNPRAHNQLCNLSLINYSVDHQVGKTSSFKNTQYNQIKIED